MTRLLLVGNSRWHWAEPGPTGLRCWHEPPRQAAPPQGWQGLRAWAAVGAVPPQLGLPPQRCLDLTQVPLLDLPAWLGIDRALAGWWAWSQQGQAVLVADAGTALSLTLVDQAGRFGGGRISAGLALQLRSLGQATAQLPALISSDLSAMDLEPWPHQTQAAMLQGCLKATAAAIAQGWRDRLAQSAEPPGRLWLTGGDGPLLAPLLRQQGLPLTLAPDLCLEALAALS